MECYSLILPTLLVWDWRNYAGFGPYTQHCLLCFLSPLAVSLPWNVTCTQQTPGPRAATGSSAWWLVPRARPPIMHRWAGCALVLRRTKTTRSAPQQTTKRVWHLCLPGAQVWGLCSPLACWPQERRLTLSYRQESIAMAPLGAQTSCKLLQWLTLMCCRCNIESW